MTEPETYKNLEELLDRIIPEPWSESYKRAVKVLCRIVVEETWNYIRCLPLEKSDASEGYVAGWNDCVRDAEISARDWLGKKK
jgi:hypothetical protein